MRRVSCFFVFVLFLAGLTTPAAVAQESDDSDDGDATVLRVLGVIPDLRFDAPIEAEWKYADYQAVLETRFEPGDWPASTSDFLAMDDLTRDLYFAALAADSNSFEWFQTLPLLDTAASMEVRTGIDPLAVRQSFYFGIPPADGLVLFVNYDRDTVLAAYGARGYTVQSEDAGLTLLCGPDGCDSGTRTNVADQSGDVFSGRFGRSQPVVLGDGWLMSSPDIQVAQTFITRMTGDVQTFAEADEVRAIIDVLLQRGDVLQTWFINPLNLVQPGASDLIFYASPNLRPEEREQIRERLLEEACSERASDAYVELPVYLWSAFALVADEDTEYGVIALTTHTEQAAQDAADAMLARVNTYRSITRGRMPLRELIDGYGAVSTATGYSEAADRYVALLLVETPIPSNEPITDDPFRTSPFNATGLSWRWIARDFYAQDMPWLCPDALCPLDCP